MKVETYEFDAGPDAFRDTAAIVHSLDLIIACDSAVGHLAGALTVREPKQDQAETDAGEGETGRRKESRNQFLEEKHAGILPPNRRGEPATDGLDRSARRTSQM